MLEHGGRLRQAALTYGIPPEEWLDLSTGINPHPWPTPPIPQTVWQRLPEEEDGLEAAAAAYYGNPNLLPVAGSQAAIQALPGLFPRAMVTCISPVYAEHPYAWEKYGHKVRHLQGNLQRALTAMTPYVLVCNPNNPTGTHYARDDLLAAASTLKKRGGWLIVDEAFMDSTPADSLTDVAGTDQAPNVLVLRSLGKFFGLAGARVGFLFGPSNTLTQLKEHLGPWALSGPARFIAQAALKDAAWQTTARQHLQSAAARLQECLAPLGPTQATSLFVTVNAAPTGKFECCALHEFFAKKGILVRHFPEHQRLRFGLPGPESEWQRLSRALAELE